MKNNNSFHHFILSISLLLILPLTSVFGQKTTNVLQQRAAQIQKSDSQVESVSMSQERGTPDAIIFRDAVGEQAYKLSDAQNVMVQKLNLRKSTDKLENMQTIAFKNGLKLERFQQYFQGIKVAHGQYLALAKNEELKALTGEFYSLSDNFDITPVLNEAMALQSAMNWVGAEQYAWEYVAELRNMPGMTKAQYNALQAYYDEYYPKGELVIVDDFYTDNLDLDIAYKFNIYAAAPLSRAWIYVNARTGKIMLRDAIIKHANGDTRYAGNRTFGSTSGTCANGQFELLNNAKGGGFETRDMQGVGGLPLSVPAAYGASTCFQDNDGNWTEAEHTTPVFVDESQNDDFALDAHWGAEVVYDYWFIKHGRLSYDNNNAKITSYIHYGQGYDNAFWNGSAMTYGDGSWQQGSNPTGSFAPLTSMDVCGHEIGHAICSNTSDLVYEKESGAMNEGFSDIWAACVERYVLDSIDNSLAFDPWGIGEQIDETDGGAPAGSALSSTLRWMDVPKVKGDPDTYGGTNWKNPICQPTLANDYCGVHSNSAVLNKWFYLMVTGSGQPLSLGAGKPLVEDGINDMGFVYTVNGIGFAKAEKIAYLTETLLTPTSTYANARAKSILAAGTLYGACSPEQNTVIAAWDAVNVTGSGNNCTPRVEFATPSATFSEAAPNVGCNAKRTVSIPVYAISVNTTAAISAVGTGTKPATAGTDFNLLTTSINFGTGTNHNIDIEILDDGLVETNETLLISIAGYSSTFTLTISDNDVNPIIGSGDVVALATQPFSSTTKPNGWDIITLGEGGNLWKFNGTGTAAGKAYITNAVAPLPVYDLTVATNTILVSPKIDGRGKNTFRLTFDWTAGGEVDAADPTLLFDYGSVGYSLDGENFTFFKDFVGTAAGAVMASGALNEILPAFLNNKEFYIGFRWYNDALVGTAHSFTIDNVNVTGKATPIETAVSSLGESKVGGGESIYFYSNTGKILAKVKNLSNTNLDCVSLKIENAGTGQVPLSGGFRSEKVYSISGSGITPTSEYQLTLYFTANEVAVWGTDVEDLGMIKTTAANFTQAYLGNAVLVPAITGTVNANNDRSFVAYFTGAGKIALEKNVELFGCNIPFDVVPAVTLLKDVQARIDWPNIPGLTQTIKYVIEYRIVGSSNWISRNLSNSVVLLANLTPGANYEYRIKNKCDVGYSDYSPVYTFTTSACTKAIPTASNIGMTTATISWTAVPSATKYYLQYKTTGGTLKTLTFTSATSANLTGLTAGTTYQFRMQVTCPWGLTGYTGFSTFQTATSMTNGSMLERGADENEVDASMYLFPNPTTNLLTVGFGQPNLDAPVILVITDQLGRQVYFNNQLGLEMEGFQEINVDVSNFAEGVYILHYSNGGNIQSEKFVKQ